VIGGIDSGVPNYALEDGCTINDLIDDERVWPSRGAFLNHVNEVVRELLADGVITARERGYITTAAARADVVVRPR